MVYCRKKRFFSRRPRRRYRSKASAASAIQKAFRRRRNKARVFKSIKNFAVKKVNRSPSEMKYKSFTILCPDSQFIDEAPIQYQDSGLVGADPATNQYRNCFQLGMFLRDTAEVNDTIIFSQELKNYLKLYRQARIVHGSVTMMRYCESVNDGNPSTGTPPTGSIGYTGTKEWISYVHSVIDNGSFKDANNLQALSVPPLLNLASTNENEYLSNSNARLTQMSHDSKKSFKTKILPATTQSEWAAQRYGIFNNAAVPVQQVAYKCNAPWIDTNVLIGVADNTYLAGNENYNNVRALTMLPPLSVYGTNFPVTVSTAAALPVATSAPLHKVLLSICVAFRVPTTRA